MNEKNEVIDRIAVNTPDFKDFNYENEYAYIFGSCNNRK